MNIEIHKLSETDYTFSDVHSLIKEVYEKRAKEGIHFQALSQTTYEIEKRIRLHDGVVFVAIDIDSNDLVGTGTILFHKDKHGQPFCGFVLEAVKETAQGKGIGTMIRKRREKLAIEKGNLYISSSTAEKAYSSIRYHLRCGSVKYGYYSAPNTDYYSINFRKYLHSDSRWIYLYCSIRYYIVKFYTKLMKKQNGKFTVLGGILHKFVHYIK